MSEKTPDTEKKEAPPKTIPFDPGEGGENPQESEDLKGMPEDLTQDLIAIAREETLRAQKAMEAKEAKEKKEDKKDQKTKDSKLAGQDPGSIQIPFKGVVPVEETEETLVRKVEMMAEKQRKLHEVEVLVFDLCDTESAREYAQLRKEKLSDSKRKIEISMNGPSIMPDPAAPRGFRSIVVAEVRRFEYVFSEIDQEFIQKRTEEIRKAKENEQQRTE